LVPMAWRIRRGAVSAFLLFHLAALVAWNLPPSALQARIVPWFRAYMLPTGLWQNWTMFAPNPMRHAVMLQALAMDRNGMVYEYKFPRVGEMSLWRAIPRVRHSKFPTYLMSGDYAAHREMTARYVVRDLGIPRESFPVDVELQYAVREAPPLGQVPDPMAPLRTEPIKAFRFPSWEEVCP
jgi:hypothetical protein